PEAGRRLAGAFEALQGRQPLRQRDDRARRAILMTAPGLATLGNPAASYVHRDKFVEPGETIVLPTAILKWYDLARSETPVEADVRALARRFLERESDAGRLDLGGDLGFVILHRCGAEFYFLLVSTWRNENELWESVFAKDNAAAEDFRTYPFKTTH